MAIEPSAVDGFWKYAHRFGSFNNRDEGEVNEDLKIERNMDCCQIQ